MELDREGFQIHVHAIGDRAIRMTLDAFAYSRARNGAHARADPLPLVVPDQERGAERSRRIGR